MMRVLSRVNTRLPILKILGICLAIYALVFLVGQSTGGGGKLVSLGPHAAESREVYAQTGHWGLNDADQVEIEVASLPDARPDEAKRTFQLKIAEDYLDRYAQKISDPRIRQIFRNTWPSTLDTTIIWHDPDTGRRKTAHWLPRTFVITGDIPAMWLRDSAAQIHPYLPLLEPLKEKGALPAKELLEVEKLYDMVLGVLYQQSQGIIHHPWSNAFQAPPDANDHIHSGKLPLRRNRDKVHPYPPELDPQKPQRPRPPREWLKLDGGVNVWESKYEVDSIAYFLKLAADIAHYSGRRDFLDSPTWISALETAVSLLQSQQRSTSEDVILSSPQNAAKPTWNKDWDKYWGSQAGGQYTFQRSDFSPTESRALGGRGEPAAHIGLVKSAFRPSDDATLLPFSIPGNAMLAVNLERISLLLPHSHLLAEKINSIAKQIRAGISDYGRIEHGSGSRTYAYEIDGFGGQYFMDDANVPSLLSLPYLGFVDHTEPVYQATRAMILSTDRNKYFFSGPAGSGVGGPHIGINYAWPMSIIMQAMTSVNDTEIASCLYVLCHTTAGTGLMHESFHVEVMGGFNYTRPWFSWANGLFGELIVKLVDTKPHLL